MLTGTSFDPRDVYFSPLWKHVQHEDGLEESLRTLYMKTVDVVYCKENVGPHAVNERRAIFV